MGGTIGKVGGAWHTLRTRVEKCSLEWENNPETAKPHDKNCETCKPVITLLKILSGVYGRAQEIVGNIKGL